MRDAIKFDREQNRVHALVEEGLACARSLQYPMCLLPLDVFKKGGRLRAHEEVSYAGFEAPAF